MKYPIYVINYCNPNLYLAACVGHHLIILIIHFPHFPQPTFFFGCSQCFKLKQTRSMRGRNIFSNFLLLVLGLLLILPSWSCNYLVNSVEIYRRNSFKPNIYQHFNIYQEHLWLEQPAPRPKQQRQGRLVLMRSSFTHRKILPKRSTGSLMEKGWMLFMMVLEKKPLKKVWCGSNIKKDIYNFWFKFNNNLTCLKLN